MTILEGFLLLLLYLAAGLLLFRAVTWLAGLAERLIFWIRGRRL